MTKKTTVDDLEIVKFAHLATAWWNSEGPLKTLHDINPARLQFIQRFTSFLGQTILDVGCGGGILTEGLCLRGAKVTGLDVEPDAIAAATAHALENKMAIDYVCQPIEDYEGGPFDVITCMEMLEHVQEPQLVIEHCARLLKPGGYLVLSTINRTLQAYASVILAAEYILRLLPRQTHDFDKFIKPSELAAIVRATGFDTVGMTGMSYNPLTRVATLQDSIRANYLLACQKA